MAACGTGSLNSPIVIDDSDDDSTDAHLVAQQLQPASLAPSPSPPDASSTGKFSQEDTTPRPTKPSKIEAPGRAITDGKGYDILVRMGYKAGFGLGPQLEGLAHPIASKFRLRRSNVGLGGQVVATDISTQGQHEDQVFATATMDVTATRLHTSPDTRGPKHLPPNPLKGGVDASASQQQLPSQPPQPVPPLPMLPPSFTNTTGYRNHMGDHGFHYWPVSSGSHVGFDFDLQQHPFFPAIPLPAFMPLGPSFPGLSAMPGFDHGPLPSGSFEHDYPSTNQVAARPFGPSPQSSEPSAPLLDRRIGPSIILLQSKLRHIGMPPDGKVNGTRGCFANPTLSPPPDPTRSLVMELLPKKFRTEVFIRDWLSQFSFSSQPRFEVDQGKALIEFASVAAARTAFDSPRMGGAEGLQGVRLFRYRAAGPSPLEEGEVLESSPPKEKKTRRSQRRHVKATSASPPDPLLPDLLMSGMPAGQKPELLFPITAMNDLPASKTDLSHGSIVPTLNPLAAAYSPRKCLHTDSLLKNSQPSHNPPYIVPPASSMSSSHVDEDTEVKDASSSWPTTQSVTTNEQDPRARQRALEQKISREMADMNGVGATVDVVSQWSTPQSSNILGSVDAGQSAREESLRKLVLLSKRKRTQTSGGRVDVTADPTTLLEPGQQIVSQSQASTLLHPSSSAASFPNDCIFSHVSSTSSSTSLSLDELADSFIASAIEGSQPPSTKRYRVEKIDLAQRQKELESHIAESKHLMPLLETAGSKAEKDKIMSRLRVLRRRMDDIAKTFNSTTNAISPPIHAKASRATLSRNFRWPETGNEAGFLVISDSEDDYEDDA